MESFESFEISVGAAVKLEITKLRAQLSRDKQAREEQSEEHRKSFERELNVQRGQVQQLQDENKNLRDRLESEKPTPTSCPVTVLVQENEDLKHKLKGAKVDYSKLSKTKDIVEKNYRFLREVQVEWKTFYQNWQKHQSNENAETTTFAPDPQNPSDRRSSSLLASVIISAENPHSPVRKEQDPLDPSDLPATQAACRPDEVPNIYNAAEMAETAASSTSGRFLFHDISSSPQKTEDVELPKSTKSSSYASSGSSPIIISERSLKKTKPSKRATPEISIHEDATAGAHCTENVKMEDEASSPLQPLRNVNSQGKTGESLDLDEFRGTLYTPRKRQRLHEVSPELQTPQVASALVDQLNDAPRDGMSWKRGTAKCLDRRTMQQAYVSIYDLPLSSSSPKPSQPSASTDSGSEEGENHHQTLDVECGERWKTSRGAENQRGATDELRDHEITRDVRAPGAGLPRTSDAQMQCPPSRRDRGAAAVPDVAEDGEPAASSRRRSFEQAKATGGRSTPVSITSPKDSKGKLDAHRRLGSMLNYPCAPKSPLSVKKVQPSDRMACVPTSPGQARGGSTGRLTTPQSLPAPKNKLTVPTTSKSARPASSKRLSPITYLDKRSTAPSSATATGPEDEPIRARPVHRLRLEDFKLNPKHSEYAFNEILRKHDEKKSRAGCTDPFCQRCKDLRKFVEASNWAAPKPSGIFDSSPPDEADKAAEEKLLKDYLGHDIYRLAQMNQEEKAELLLKAKTKQFADQFGKHRQTYTRAPETAGYWNMDFPSTQENERDREENKVIERLKIEERWQEALRDGMWIFADEA